MRKVGAVLTGTMLLLARAAFAEPPIDQASLEVAVDVSITEDEEWLVREYFAHSFDEPDALPEDITFAPGERLPAGLSLRPLPSKLEARLPARPGYEWLLAGHDALLVSKDGAIVVGVLSDIF